jgi:hypothetical protein
VTCTPIANPNRLVYGVMIATPLLRSHNPKVSTTGSYYAGFSTLRTDPLFDNSEGPALGPRYFPEVKQRFAMRVFWFQCFYENVYFTIVPLTAQGPQKLSFYEV